MAIKVSGVWKNQVSTNVKVGGTWKAAASGWVRLSGVWREFVANTLSLGYANTAFTIGSANQTKSPTVSGGYTSQAKTFALVSGALPKGVRLNASSGVLTGPGTWNFPASASTGAGTATVVGIVLTSDGGAIVYGFFNTGSITFGSTTLALAGSPTIFLAKLSNTGAWSWAARNTGTGITSTASMSLAATSDGGAIVSGTFANNSITFGSTTLPLTGVRSAFVAKISSAGAWSWAAGSTGTGQLTGGLVNVLATSDGGAVITSNFSNAAITFGSTTLSLTGTVNLFVAKVSNTGAWSWAVANTGTGDVNSALVRGTTDGNFIIGGQFAVNSITIGSTTLPLTGGGSIFVAKISNTGSWLWASTNTGPGSIGLSGAYAGGATSDGGAIFGGIFNTNSVTLGSTTLAFTAISNIWVAKISSAGAWSWAAQSTGTGNNPNNLGFTVTSDDGVIATGRFSFNSITFGSTTLALAGGNTLYVAKASNTGSWSWAARNTGTGTVGTAVPQVALTSDGGAIITQRFASNSIIFGSTTLALAGTTTAFAARISNTGAWLWAARNTGTGVIGAGAAITASAATNDDAATISIIFGTNSITFGATTLALASPSTVAIAKINNNGDWGSTSQAVLGFPSAVTVSVTDSSGTVNTSPTITAV